MEIDLKQKIWWGYLEEDLQELLKTAILLTKDVSEWSEELHDYSFVVFPASKAYEGFLKKLFFDLKFISDKDFWGKRFRVGKALNPSLNRSRYKNESVYDKLVALTNKDLADQLWNTWKNCRNLLFHWFPKEKRAISFKEAKEKVMQVIESIDAAYSETKVKV